MKYVLALISAVIIILAVILIQKNYKQQPAALEIKNIAELVHQLKPLVDEVSLKNFQSNDEIYSAYENQLMMIDTLSEQIIDNITSIKSIKKYNEEDYRVFCFGIKMDLLSMLSNISSDEYNNKMTAKSIAQSFVNDIDLYLTPLKSLYYENINVYDYLSDYKAPYYNHEQGMQEYERQLSFLNNMKKVTETLNLSKEDKNIREKLMENSTESYVLYSINSGLYENIEQFAQWEVYKNKYIFGEYQHTFLKNLYKYKSVKLLKNISLSKIYMQFMILDDKYESGLSGIEKMEQEYPEEFYEESTLFVSGCTNPEYLLENTLNKCIDFIKNAETKDDAFSYLEDENIAGYVMINDNLCAKKDDFGYRFYDNDNIMCKTLKEKLDYKAVTNMKELLYYINELRPFVDNVTKRSAEMTAKGENIDSVIYIDGIIVDKLATKAVESISEIRRLKKYNEELYNAVKYIAMVDLASYINQMAGRSSQEIADVFLSTVRMYTEQLYNICSEGIDVNEFLESYTLPQNIADENKQEFLLDVFKNIHSMVAKYTLLDEDKPVINKIFQDGQLYLKYTVVLIKQNNDNLKVWNDILFLKHYSEETHKILLKFLNYRIAKTQYNTYFSKIYAKLFLIDKSYLKKSEEIFSQDTEKKAYINQLAGKYDSLLAAACKNPDYITENSLEACINTLKTKNKDEAFSYLEDYILKGYAVINDKVCVKKEKSGFKFYDNDNRVCVLLQEKLQ